MAHFYPVIINSGRSAAGASLGFHAYSLRIDNLTNQWLLEETSMSWVPPYSLGMCLRLYGTGVAIILNQAPTGQPQLAPIAGEQTVGVYSDQLRTEVAGVPVRQFTIVQSVSDLTQGPEPALPPVGVDRLWADTLGRIHHVHSDGTDYILTDPSQTGVVTSGMIADGTIQAADIGPLTYVDLAYTTDPGQPAVAGNNLWTNQADGRLYRHQYGQGSSAGVLDTSLPATGALSGTWGNPAIATNGITSPAQLSPPTVGVCIAAFSRTNDIWNNVALAGTDNGLSGGSTNATLFDQYGLVLINVNATAAILPPAGQGTHCGWSLFIDGTFYRMGPMYSCIASQDTDVSWSASFMVAGPNTLAGTLSAGVHTFELRVRATTAISSGAFLLCASAPSLYRLQLEIVAIQR